MMTMTGSVRLCDGEGNRTAIRAGYALHQQFHCNRCVKASDRDFRPRSLYWRRSGRSGALPEAVADSDAATATGHHQTATDSVTDTDT
jgi:hypothetical protein